MSHLPADERRRLLARAALTVMAREGIAAATTRAITAEAAMPQASFHYCFRSKDELLGLVIETMVNQQVSAALATVRPRKDVRRAFREGFRAYWRVVEDSPGEQLVTYELTQYALRTPGLEELARRQYAAYLRGATEVLDTLAEVGGFAWTEPTPVLARLLVSILDGLTLSWIVDRDDEQAQAVLRVAAAQFASYVRPARRRRSA